MNLDLWEILFLLIGAHYLCDFPLQGDYLAKAKNRNTELGKDIWAHALFAHGMIHAIFVFMITGFMTLAIMELIIHMHTDYQKCEGRISFRTDQMIHLYSKLLYVILISLLPFTS